MRRGALFDALEAAARGGAHVSVRLEGAPCGDADGSFARVKRRASSRSCVAPASTRARARRRTRRFTQRCSSVDGTRYLDDRNFGAGDLVVRDDDPADPALATHKREALAAEGKLLRGAQPGDDTIVESESFGCCNAVYSALDDAAKRGLHPRVLVCARELRGNDRERDRLAQLAADGARVRVTKETDKLALAGDRALDRQRERHRRDRHCPDTIDWGVCTDDAAIVAAARARVESTWAHAKPL